MAKKSLKDAVDTELLLDNKNLKNILRKLDVVKKNYGNEEEQRKPKCAKGTFICISFLNIDINIDMNCSICTLKVVQVLMIYSGLKTEKIQRRSPSVKHR